MTTKIRSRYFKPRLLKQAKVCAKATKAYSSSAITKKNNWLSRPPEHTVVLFTKLVIGAKLTPV